MVLANLMALARVVVLVVFMVLASIMVLPHVMVLTALGKPHVRILGVQPAFCRKGEKVSQLLTWPKMM